MTSSSPNGYSHGPVDQLLRAALEGSQAAIGELFQSCRGYLLAIGERELPADLRIKVSPSDLVQETFAEGQKALPNFCGATRDEFLMWLRVIYVHKLAHASRKYKGTLGRDIAREERQPDRSSILDLAEQILDEETPCREVIRKEDEAALHAAMTRLPEMYRLVIRLHDFEGVSFQNMSQLLGPTDGALRAMWLRAVSRLKKELNGHDFS